jgi:hypothetical protein
MKAIYFLFQDQTGLLRQVSFCVFFHAGQPPYPKMNIKYVYNTTMHSASEKILKQFSLSTQHFSFSTCDTIHGIQMPLGGISTKQCTDPQVHPHTLAVSWSK